MSLCPEKPQQNCFLPKITVLLVVNYSKLTYDLYLCLKFKAELLPRILEWKNVANLKLAILVKKMFEIF